jgi:tRNA nucleotidyltransferase (CCA-adding enzyme)
VVLRLDDRLKAGQRELLARVGEIAAEMDLSAFLVGGPVRDLLLDRPAPDLDVSIEGPVHPLAERLAERLDARVRKTSRFMTAALVLRDGSELDLARTRTESYPEPGALPLVEPAGLADDIRRRDFSVNAMAAALEPGRFGQLIDPLGGLADLQARRLRVLHDRSFIDDPTRMLRAVRFMLRLQFELEAHTRELLDRANSQRRLSGLSGARLRNELARIFRESPARGLRTLQELDLLQGMGLAPASEAACEASRHLPEAARVLDLDLRKSSALATCLGVYAGLSGQDAGAVAVRLMLDGQVRRSMCRAALLIEEPPQALRDELPDSELYFALRGTPAAAVVSCWAASEPPVRARLERYWHELRDVVADVDGEDLIALGYRPGPGFGPALEVALAARIDFDAAREEQLAAALDLLREDTERT